MESGPIYVLAGALAGGFVNGLTGMGTGMTALPIWAHVLPPALASPLTVACSIVSQLQTLPAIWHAIEPRRVLPFVAGGLLGVPFGVVMLPMVEAATFKTAVGALLVAACLFLLLHRKRGEWSGGGRAADAGVGLAGGVLGGLAGLSGILPTLWTELRGWEKDKRRAVLQGYNISVLVFALVSQAISGFLTAELGKVLLVALPGTILGAWLGRRLYGRLDTARFSRVVLVLLTFGGVVLVATGLRAA
jgi:uncharacterized protein